MPDDVNVQLLLAKLPVDSLARKLVELFAEQQPDVAARAAHVLLAAVKATHLKRDTDDPADAA